VYSLEISIKVLNYLPVVKVSEDELSIVQNVWRCKFFLSWL